MSRSPRLRAAGVADDLTGAADTGVQFVRAGYRTAVLFRGEDPPEEVEAVVIDTDSRALEPDAARGRVLEAGGILAEARIAYKKLDSTLRGPVAAELAAALEASGRRAAVVAPAFPGAGRTTRSGVQMVRGVPAHETGLARDPVTPVRESRIPKLLAGLGTVRTLGLEDLGDEKAVRAAIENAVYVVADAETDAHLEALVRAVPDPSRVLWAGSAGLARALAAVYPGPRSSTPSAPPFSVSSVVVVVGSVSEVSREQLRRLAAEPGVVAVPLDSRLVAPDGSGDAVGEASAAVRTAISGGRSVALYSTQARAEESGRIADALAEVVGRLSAEGMVHALVMTGGDTAVRVARGLGARGILLVDELEAGVPVGALIGPLPYPVITKAGGFGKPETLVEALRKLRGGKERS